MAATMDDLPAAVRDLCAAYLHGLRTNLSRALYAVHLHGAVAFPSPWPVGDLDFHAILAKAPAPQEGKRLHDLHAGLARQFPHLGSESDAQYSFLDDALRASPHPHLLVPGVYDESWALHRAHLRAGRCIIFFGPDPGEFLLAPSWRDLQDALHAELRFVKDQLGAYPAYCVLNLCRLMVSLGSRDVVISKYEAANWAGEAFPESRHLIEAASRSYAQTATVQDAQVLRSGVGNFYRFACERIGETSISPDG